MLSSSLAGASVACCRCAHCWLPPTKGTRMAFLSIYIYIYTYDTHNYMSNYTCTYIYIYIPMIICHT